MTPPIERTEVLVPGPAEALAALLDVPLPDIVEGLPLLWHWIYLLDRPAQRDLGADGHPTHGGIPEPPEPGRRRMFAGGQVRTLAPLRVGEPATRRTEVVDQQEKTGRTGRLTFVTVNHRITQRGILVIDERQDLVYRDAVATAAPAQSAELTEVPAAQDEWSVPITPTLLFRYSALTYNGHRIHYDRDYARDIEGYPGLVTHGPLQATVMAEAARARGHQAISGLVFDHRSVAPLFDNQGLVVRANSNADDSTTTTSVRDKYGRITAKGALSLAH
ncbi:FAS1-like dehydratase domain-containing protein [Antrihabitans stalactiti]|uniref:Mesaconyl-C4 CoA hydratase n=1 Tax=Antrihabitans stalactiti TaxID=2584121 RepID=A0A848KCV0_9NOCA|nr:MaoC family dehydratase N-terminal domain-containing protein [Antrihabitans stalactiti]NMN93877.1 mesaconyl-C4 CoA hydratase [Antrihabitans stalactiti]